MVLRQTRFRSVVGDVTSNSRPTPRHSVMLAHARCVVGVGDASSNWFDAQKTAPRTSRVLQPLADGQVRVRICAPGATSVQGIHAVQAQAHVWGEPAHVLRQNAPPASAQQVHCDEEMVAQEVAADDSSPCPPHVLMQLGIWCCLIGAITSACPMQKHKKRSFKVRATSVSLDSPFFFSF